MKNKKLLGLIKTIENSEFGFFGKMGEETKFFNSHSHPLEMERKVSKEKDGIVIRISARNKEKKSVKVFSFVIGEFILPVVPKEVLEYGWLQCSEAKYKTLSRPTKKKHVFLRRDQNPFSFEKKYGYLSDSIVSEWFTVLRMGDKSLVIGAITTADQFSQIFMRVEEGRVRIRVTSQYDGLTIRPGETVKSEKIFFFFGDEKKALNNFAKLLARSMKVKKIKPPIKAMCCSYYWNGNKITEEIINKELSAIESLPDGLKMDYIQLDAGYTRYFGDWLDYKKRFPGGLKSVVDRIKSLGYKAGIWLSPFAINPKTKLHEEHKSWFLRDGVKGHFEGRLTSPVDSLVPDLDLEVLDPTNKEVQRYLKNTLKHFKKLGFELYKLDFMYPVCLSTKYSVPMTRVQALREGVKLIRKVVGDDAHLLSGIAPLSPMVGLVDSARLGIDTLNPFVCGLPGVKEIVNNVMLSDNIEESKIRMFLNGVVWTSDPDCLVFREGTGIKESLIKEHKKLATENNMSLWLGDSIARMDEKHKKEVVKFFNEN